MVFRINRLRIVTVDDAGFSALRDGARCLCCRQPTGTQGGIILSPVRDPVSLCRLEGASAVRNGRAQMRCAQGIGASSITLSQRRPDALTKCPWLERTGSR